MNALRIFGRRTMEDRYTLRYYGREADAGKMGYYDAATVILAFGDFVGINSRAAYGKDARVKTSVAATQDGSLAFNFIIDAGSILSTIAGPITPAALWTLIQDSIATWKFLKGHPAEKITSEGDQVTILNIYGDVQTFNQHVQIVLADPKAGKAVERIFKLPLEEAASEVEIIPASNPESKIIVNEDDSSSFVDLSESNIVNDTNVQLALLIISPVFLEGNKWRFSDGDNRFSAEIEDEEFLHRVDTGESFAKGEYLIVDCRIVQEIVGGRLTTTRTITKVLKHERPTETEDWITDDERE